MPNDMPAISVSYWGKGPEIEHAVAAVYSEHAKLCHRLQQQRDSAEAVSNLVRDAILGGHVSRADVMSLLVTAPPPPLSLRQRIAATLRVWRSP
jgi:hypothetical protein